MPAEFVLEWNESGALRAQTIREGDTLTLGRAPDCDVCLGHHPTLSRRHAALTVRQDAVLVETLSLTNPIELAGGRQLEHGERAALAPGDTLRAGPVELRIRAATPSLARGIKCGKCGTVYQDIPEQTCRVCGRMLVGQDSVDLPR